MHTSILSAEKELEKSMLRLSLAGDDDDEEFPIPAPKAFPFFALPAELRTRIYEFMLLTDDRSVDLDPNNYRRVGPLLRLTLVSKQMRVETSRVFYGRHTFRLFPMHPRFIYTKVPLLARITTENRSAITCMELRLGPGWTAPPRCQKVDDKLGLQDCESLRTLKVFVEIDPSQDVFNGFRGYGKNKESYKMFCVALLQEILEQAPYIVTVEVDAYPSVSKDSTFIVGLVKGILEARKKVVWGPLRGWHDDQDCGRLGLESALAGMSL